MVDQMEGWLSDNEGELLYDLAKRCQGKGVIVEIGSFKGKSTIWLAKGTGAGNQLKIYAIDPHSGYTEHDNTKAPTDTFSEFTKNIKTANVESQITPIVDFSQNAVKSFTEPIELLFIDGSHKYEAVKQDFYDWVPKLIDGGTVAFHDTIGMEGPRSVVNEFVFLSKKFKNIKVIDQITCAVKTNDVVFLDHVKNLGALIIKKISEWAVIIKLPKSLRVLGKKILKNVQK